MSIDESDVLTHLRAGGDRVEEREFDAQEVLSASRQALRRRRSWQAVGACTTAAAVTFSLALAGPVRVPGMGDFTLPGSEQVRELFGLADATECAVPEPAARRDAIEPDGSPHPGLAFNLLDARPMSTCFDVSLDEELPSNGLLPDTVTEVGALWGVSPVDGPNVHETTDDGYMISYRVSGTDSYTSVTGTLHVENKETTATGLTTQGRRAAWYETAAADSEEAAETPRTIRVAGTANGDIRAIGEAPALDTGPLTMSHERVAWRHGTTVSVAPFDGSGEPETLTENGTAVGGDDDEIVVATLDQSTTSSWSTTFTSYGDDGSETEVLTLVHLRGTQVRLVDLTDDVLTYALEGSDLTVLPRANGIVDPDPTQGISVRLGNDGTDNLTASGDTVAWVVGSSAYLLQGVGSSDGVGPDLLRVAQSRTGDRVMVGLAGDRIAWNASVGPDVQISVGILRSPEELPATRTEPPEVGTRAVPVAPTVTVPADAVFPTYD